jgi:tartrate-resistant acid phosphatase type 5
VFALDSTQLDATQRAWLARELQRSKADWKLVILHHPLYSSGRYRQPSRIQRWYLEELFVRNDVDTVFSGHEHFYERMHLQNGIQYFISGGSGAVRRGEAADASFVASRFDDDCQFMLVEITADELYFQAISRTGATIDAGILKRERPLHPVVPVPPS